jgi:hypothetical protein
MALPRKDPDLLSFGSNFSSRITASPVTFGLVALQATQYAALLATYLADYNAMKTARDSGNRSQSLTTQKNISRAAFLSYARDLYSTVQANTSVSDADKNLLGIVVRAAPSPQPSPSSAPVIDILSVVGRTVSIRLHDIGGKKTKPPFVKGASVFSFVGDVPPSTGMGWHLESNTTRNLFDIQFPDSVAPGAKVWITASWFNERSQSGPGTTPISTNVQFGGVAAA